MPTLVVAAPRAPLVSRAFIKLHCRISLDVEDLLLETWIRSAMESIEAETWRQLVTGTFEYKGDCFPRGSLIRLPRAPLRRVESITYLDDAGVLQTFNAANYRVVHQGDDEPGYVELGYGKTWPTTYPVRNAVTIRFVGGYATAFTANPTSDVLTAAGHPYVDGDPVRLWTPDGDLPSPLTADREYFARDVAAGASLRLAETAGGVAINVEDAGGGLNFLGVPPASLVHAIALLVRHADENREPVITGTIVAEMPRSVRSLISPFSLADRL